MATGLIFSFINVASAEDMLFRQPQQLQCLHHASTESYLCFPLSSILFSTATLVTICGTRVITSV